MEEKTKRKIKNKRERGITLIALVITIIVLLILAGVSIAMLTGENGILVQAQNANEQTEIGEEKEEIILSYNGLKTKKQGGDVTAGELETELKTNGAEVTVSGDETLVITFFDSDRTYIIDTNENISLITGNAREILNNAKVSYGATVTNYDSDKSTGVNWKIFYSDGINVYLIADDYIDYEKVPLSIGKTNKPNQSDSFSKAAYFTNILGDYKGSINITNSNPAYKWLSKYYEAGYTSQNNNMKAVAYMMDTNIWTNFKKDTALYAIGGPTLEMLFASYNMKYETEYECQATSEIGYSIRKTSTDDWNERIVAMFEPTDSLYEISNQTNALAYWIATPSNYYKEYDVGNYLMSTYYVDGGVTYSFFDSKDIGFRPIVCLKLDTKLVKQSDGSYQIQ